MSNIWFMSDLHLGHRNILKYRPEFSSIEEHDDTIIDNCNSVMHKRDILWLLGDICFTSESLELLKRIRGTKKIIAGNHDINAQLFTQEYVGFVGGLKSYKGFWLSHAPLHPDELRGKHNIHGHMHREIIDDSRYVNVCCEQTNYRPMSLEAIRTRV